MYRLYRSGLLGVGDRILAVDGLKTSGKSAAEVSCLITSNRTSHTRLQTLSASAARLQCQRYAASNGQHRSTLLDSCSVVISDCEGHCSASLVTQNYWSVV